MNRGKSRRSCRGDYDFRHGLTQNPITSFSVKTFPILHALLRGLDYCLKLVWKENKQNSVMIKAARKRIQEIIKAKTGLSVDKPDPVGAGGTTTATGNMARKLLFDPSKRQVLVDCIPEKIQGDGRCDRKVFNEFITNLSEY